MTLLCTCGGSGRCKCEGGGVPFLDPILLLLLLKEPSHGYEVMERLGRFGFDSVYPGKLYRHLRKLEEDQLLQSEWDTEKPGPARRLYKVTGKGQEFLREWIPIAQARSRALNSFVHEARQIL